MLACVVDVLLLVGQWVQHFRLCMQSGQRPYHHPHHALTKVLGLDNIGSGIATLVVKMHLMIALSC